MGKRIAAAAALSVLALSVGRGMAMTSNGEDNVRCRVVSAHLLSKASGGGKALCSAIVKAASAKVPDLKVSVEVHVASSTQLTARLRTDGKTLPELNYSIKDQEFTTASLQRFAEVVVDQLAAHASH